MGNGDFTVFVSRNHIFKYYDEKKITRPLANGEIYKVDFVPPTTRRDMKISEFITKLKQWKRGDDLYV